MHRQDKATTEKNTKILRELVKKSENKLCADCKRNGELSLPCYAQLLTPDYTDPRWASWNLLAMFISIDDG